MVELADTLVSGTSAVKSMEVQVFFRALKEPHPLGWGSFNNQTGRRLELPEGAPSEGEEERAWMRAAAPGGGPEPRSRSGGVEGSSLLPGIKKSSIR